MELSQWVNLSDGEGYVATTDTQSMLPPGFYGLSVVQGVGLVWAAIRVRTDHVLRFPDSASDHVIREIETFWEQEDSFIAHGIPFKRGILMHGPAGSGKTTSVRVIALEVVKRGGYVLEYSGVSTLISALRQLRCIQPETPVVVLMEDLDSILDTSQSGQSAILNMLDGVESVHKVVFLATTNYPERLDPRIIDRPSRFDRRVEIKHPVAASRKMYLETLARPEDDIDLDEYVKASRGMSLAHLKELFVATVILKNGFEDTVETLKTMHSRSSRPNSINDDDDPDADPIRQWAGFA